MEKCKNILDDVFTAKEAAERWGIDRSTVTYSCTGQKGYPPRFRDEECRKYNSIWLVTRAGMERLYGKEGERIKKDLPSKQA